MTAEQLRMAIFKDVLTGKLTHSKDVAELKAIDDEYFDIYQVPATWDIVTLQESCYIHARIGWQALRKDEHQKSGDYLLVTGTDFKDGLVNYSTCVYVSKERYELDEKIQIQNDDILVTKDGSIGKVAVVKNLPMPATLNAGVFVIRPDDRFDKRYIEYLFQGSYFTHFVNLVKSGTTIKHLNQNKLLQFKIPVPSKEEQREIVKALDKLLPFVDKFKQLDNKVKKINSKFPEDMKKSILQYAIQGKLVEQRPEEGTAEELYQKIRDELKQLEKSKLFKVKDDNPIEEEEIPFDIPSSWKWLRLGQILNIESGKGLTAKQMKKGDIPVYGGNGITGYHNEALIHKETVVIGRVGFYCGSVHVTPSEAWVTDNAFITTYPEKNIYRDYLVYVLRFLNLGKNSNATAQPVVSGKKIYPMLFPLPPLEEQKRIVAKIDEILPICERLVK
ncbi:MAG: restriction endonuclease subunit S [Butyrivibrio sp.]|nr:restriction endonuclease subunit S [Butyrivibrio sp.]